jgi:hypothetical protein
MCRGGVGSILVMFDVLNCYILYMCLLLFVYYIPVLEAPRPGRQTKHDFFIKKILMFVGGTLTNIRATWGRCGWLGLPCGSYVHLGTDEHKANVAPGWLRDYVAYVRRPGGTDEHKGLRFVRSAWPMNVS